MLIFFQFPVPVWPEDYPMLDLSGKLYKLLNKPKKLRLLKSFKIVSLLKKHMNLLKCLLIYFHFPKKNQRLDM